MGARARRERSGDGAERIARAPRAPAETSAGGLGWKSLDSGELFFSPLSSSETFHLCRRSRETEWDPTNEIPVSGAERSLPTPSSREGCFTGGFAAAARSLCHSAPPAKYYSHFET